MKCSYCHLEKSELEFSFQDKERKILHKKCQLCHAQYRREHYLRNRVKYIEKAARWNKKQEGILREFVFTKLMKSHCVDCGEKDILVLDFDHISHKEFNIAVMLKNRYSLTSIKREVAKCEIRCANCHRRKTAKENGSWKYKQLNIRSVV